MLEQSNDPLSPTAISIANYKEKDICDGERKLVVFGVTLDSYPKPVQFLICCGGVFLFYLLYGYVQVRIFG